MYGDALLTAPTQPSAFLQLKQIFADSTQKVPQVAGTTTWILAIQFLHIAIDGRNHSVTTELRVLLVWFSIGVATSFVLHPIVAKNISACCLGYVFTLAFLVPRAP